mmetsp:Transcript_20568/g.51907  ORF Transcript_20568/g.51907 Transcript_20568/m.51907 type:complete len:130 (-) Transcript_20568:67-456(-)
MLLRHRMLTLDIWGTRDSLAGLEHATKVILAKDWPDLRRHLLRSQPSWLAELQTRIGIDVRQEGLRQEQDSDTEDKVPHLGRWHGAAEDWVGLVDTTPIFQGLACFATQNCLPGAEVLFKLQQWQYQNS